MQRQTMELMFTDDNCLYEGEEFVPSLITQSERVKGNGNFYVPDSKGPITLSAR